MDQSVCTSTQGQMCLQDLKSIQSQSNVEESLNSNVHLSQLQKCKTHGKDQKYYCVDHNLEICFDCTRQQQHQNCSISETKHITKELKKQYEDQLKELENKITEKKLSLLKEIKAIERVINQQENLARNVLNQFQEKILTYIQDFIKGKFKAIIKEKFQKIDENRQILKQKQAYLQQILDNAKSQKYKFITDIPVLINNFQQTQNIETQDFFEKINQKEQQQIYLEIRKQLSEVLLQNDLIDFNEQNKIQIESKQSMKESQKFLDEKLSSEYCQNNNQTSEENSLKFEQNDKKLGNKEIIQKQETKSQLFEENYNRNIIH